MPAKPARRQEYAYHDRFRIPLKRTAALNFYLRQLFVAHSRREMALAAIAKISNFAGRIALSVLGLKRAEDGEKRAPESDATLRDVCVQLRTIGVMPKGEPFFITLADYGHSSREKEVAFIFEPAEAQPSLVAKMSDNAEHLAALQREHANLLTLRERLEGLRETLPEPLAIVKEGDETAFVQKHISGPSMYLEMRNSLAPRALVGKHFQLAWDWLVAFQQATLVGESKLADHGAPVALVFADFERLFSPLPPERDFIAEIASRVRELEDEPLPVVACQGDFWARNVILKEAGLGVLDWESFTARGSPFFDVFLFTTSYGLSYPWKLGRWADPTEAFRATYGADGWMGQAVRAHLLDYCARMRISPNLLDVGIPAFLARLAIEEAESSVSGSDIGDAQGANVASAAQYGTSAKGKMWRRLFQEWAQMPGRACFG